MLIDDIGLALVVISALQVSNKEFLQGLGQKMIDYDPILDLKVHFLKFVPERSLPLRTPVYILLVRSATK